MKFPHRYKNPALRKYWRRERTRRLRAWANYPLSMPRWFYVMLLFFSGWGISELARQTVKAFLP